MSKNLEETNLRKGSAFSLEDVLPDVADSFFHSGEDIYEAIKTANIVIDTNALLLPYGAGGASIAATGAAFEKIEKEERLVIPAQVLREYIKNRPKKVGELLQGLSDSLSKLPSPPKIHYPVLEGVDEFEELKKEISDYEKLRKSIMNCRSKLHDAISSWSLRDPVIEAYRKSFTRRSIFECNGDHDTILKEMMARYENSIPPGYKDAAKDDGGTGDFIIWKTILEVGQTSKRSTIFVSGDEKSDWQHRSNNTGFLPRFELIDEYRRASEGSSFFIIQLSDLLGFFEATDETVDEIRREERRATAASYPIVACPYCGNEKHIHLATFVGASATPYCDGCGQRFHVHRRKDGIAVHPWGQTQDEASTNEPCVEACPECEHENSFELGSRTGSTRWIYCVDCGVKISAHRQNDGGILLRSH